MVPAPPAGSSPDEEHAPKRKRQRARQACIPCRQRKRKCDANLPCDMCSTYGYDCHFPEDRSPVANYVQRSGGAHTSRSSDARRLQPDHPSPNGTTHSAGGANSIKSPDAAADSPSTPANDPGIIDLSRSRFMYSSSSAAFAQAVGHELQSARPPRLHPFAYSFGIRPEERSELHQDLCLLITPQELERYSSVFFASIAPIFDVIDQPDYYRRCRAYFDGYNKDTVFACIIAGVVANASYLRVHDGHPREMELVQYAKKILDDPEHTRKPSVDVVIGWNLRVMYLRASASPNTAWFACCIVMHLSEANGLHDETIVRRLAQAHAGGSADEETRMAEKYRRLFWSSWTCNLLTSYEFGRTPVLLANMTVADPAVLPGSYLHLLVLCAKTVPHASANASAYDAQSTRTPLHNSLAALLRIPDDHPFISLSKADLCCAFYRRMRQQRLNITPDVVDQIVAIGGKALDAAAHYAQECMPWFNAFGSSFQFTCVLLALDRPSTLAHVARAVHVLELFNRAIDTPATREALATARLLLQDAAGKKRRELAVLEGIDAPASVNEQAKGVDGIAGEGLLQGGLDWDSIFDNAYENWMNGADLMQLP